MFLVSGGAFPGFIGWLVLSPVNNSVRILVLTEMV